MAGCENDALMQRYLCWYAFLVRGTTMPSKLGFVPNYLHEVHLWEIAVQIEEAGALAHREKEF